MENGYQTQPLLNLKLLPVIFVVSQLVLISLLAFFVSGFSQADEMINTPSHGLTARITNISDAIPEDYSGWSNMIEWSLFNAILGNSENKSVPKNTTLSSIRDGTIKTHHFEKYAINYARMIVDVPELAESYEVFLEYPDNKGAIGIAEPNNPDVAKPYSILCVEKSEIVYTDFNCRESPNYSTRQEIVSKTLGYFDFSDFSTSFKDDLSAIYISPINHSVDGGAKYVQEVKKAISSLGISPDIFSYHVIDNSTNT